MLISSEDVALNLQGTLTEAQLKKIRRKGVVQLVAGIVFLILVPASILMSDIRWGTFLVIWLLAGILFAGAFMWSAKSYLLMKHDHHDIKIVTGAVSRKDSGNKHVLVTVNERSFLLMKNESETLRKDEHYTLYFLEEPKIVVGWSKSENPATSIQ